MKTREPIKGIFFDVGGTLYSYRNIAGTTASVLGTLAQRLAMQHDLETVLLHYQSASREADMLYADQPFYLFRDYFETIFAGFLQRLGHPQLIHHFEWFEEHQRVTLLDCMEIKADCHETLDRLKARGFYLSAVSNADENMLGPLVERAELHRWLDHWTSSEEARSCKPDRRFFEVALDKSGLRPTEVLFVGDSLEQDIQGAHDVGMRTVLISESDVAAPMHIGREVVDPDYRIETLSMLAELVEKITDR